MSSRLYTAEQVRNLDRTAIESLGIAGFVLMQRAGAAAWRVLRARWPEARQIVVICGTGNNGGDGYVLATTAREAGVTATVIACGEPRVGSDAQRAREGWETVDGRIMTADESLPAADVYVDGLFGTGLARPIEGTARELIERINDSGRPVLALDIPSGIDADTGNVLGAAVRAEVTVSFVAHKRGLFTGPAIDFRGELVLDTLGLPDSLYQRFVPDARVLDLRRMAGWIGVRPRNAHKGLFGHVLAVGGDHGMGGAIRLAGEAALRVGAGLVSVATRREHVLALIATRPELMAHAVDHATDLAALQKSANVLVLGPGLGQTRWSRELWRAAVGAGIPTVLDADGLNLLVNEKTALPAHTILTPHPGEAARLLDCATPEVMRDRFAAARELAGRYKAVTVLKGAGSLIAHPQGEIALCPWGNPGMSSGGMGDVLSGVIGGVLAQGLNPWRAARLGVALHAQAGDAAAIDGGEAGLLASDLFAHLRRLRNAIASDAR